MKRFLVGLAYATAGLVIAVGLTAAAYAIGGRELSRPAKQEKLTPRELGRLVNAPAAPAKAAVKPSPEDSPSVDDKGGDSKVDDDKSGSNSGSGSSNSGSGSSGSGSGSDSDSDDDHDDEPDDD